MAITDLLVLPKDIVLTPVAQLSPSTRGQLAINDDDYAITRPRSRTPSKIIDAASAELLQLFQQPTTIAQAIVQYSRKKLIDPEQTLDAAIPLLENFINSKLLMLQNMPETEQITASRQIGDAFHDWQINTYLQILDDTELYRLENSAGQQAVLKISPIPQPHTTIRALLKNEAQVLKHLDGSISPKLLRDDSAEAEPYLIMEYIPGQTLDIIAAQLHSTGDRHSLLALFETILQTYSTLHAQNVVHGDIHLRNKPYRE